MKNSLKALELICIIFAGMSLASQLAPSDSFASPLLAIPTPTITPRAKAGGAASTLYLPFVSKPPAPLHLPMLEKNIPTPTPTPIPVANPVRNGGFEQPNDGETGPWYASLTYSGNPAIGIDVRKDSAKLAGLGVSPHAGNYAAWLGEFPGGQTDLLQEITIPTGASTLTYWAWIKSGEPICNTVDVNGAWIKLLLTSEQPTLESYSLCTATVTTGWVKHNLNIASYAGQTGWLDFTIRILGADSSLFIDDVSISNSANAQFGARTPFPTPR